MYGSRYAAIDQIDTTNAERLWTSDFGPDSISKRVIRPRGPGYGDGRLYPFFGTTIFSVDPATGEPDPAFADGGRIDIVAAALHHKYPDNYPPDLDPATLATR